MLYRSRAIAYVDGTVESAKQPATELEEPLPTCDRSTCCEIRDQLREGLPKMEGMGPSSQCCSNQHPPHFVEGDMVVVAPVVKACGPGALWANW